MTIVLNVIYVLLLFVYTPILWVKGKLHAGYRQRLGYIEKESYRQLADKKHIWVHAVSVGEVLAVEDLIKKIKQQSSQYPIVCTVVTKTGYELAKKTFGEDVLVLYAPLDFSWIVKKFIRAINPQVYISTETEWWPNMYWFLAKNNVSIIQVNGRISDSALKGYKKISFVTKRILSCVTQFFMQSDEQKDRLVGLGADVSKVKVLGNLKFDNLPEGDDSGDFHLKANDLWVAGSTHPGEEELLLETYNKLKQNFPDLRLVICPRHIERVSDVVSIVERKGYTPIHYTAWSKKDITAHEIIVVDTIGHLRELYAQAKIVFIGKTFKVGGGQNMMEPACFGVPTIVGPMTDNFKQVMEIFLNESAIIQIQDPIDLATEMKDLLSNHVRYSSVGSAAKRVVERYKGATTKTVEEIKHYL